MLHYLTDAFQWVKPPALTISDAATPATPDASPIGPKLTKRSNLKDGFIATIKHHHVMCLPVISIIRV